MLGLSIRQIEVFVAVVQRDGMTPAAHHLGMTQSAVSQAVTAIENGLQPLADAILSRHDYAPDVGRLLGQALALTAGLAGARGADCACNCCRTLATATGAIAGDGPSGQTTGSSVSILTP